LPYATNLDAVYNDGSLVGSDRLYDQPGEYGVAPPATDTFDVSANRMSQSHRTLASTTEIDSKYLIKAKEIEREKKLGEGIPFVCFACALLNVD
jgi:hypothetical protein